MQCYTELIAPSAVTHAVSLPFLNAKASNLVIAKTSLLQIFHLKDTLGSEDDISDSSNKSKLVLIGEYPLAGTVTSLASIKALSTKSGGEALIIAFQDAKLSLVEWDPDNDRISTTSIHYYEGDNVITQPFGPSLSECGSILTVDPSSRCAALKFGARHVAILPFRQVGDELMEGVEDGEGAEMDVALPSTALKRTRSGLNEGTDGNAEQTPYRASFVLPLTALDPSLTHPVHLAFLHEYREPTFGILSATIEPSISLLDERKDVVTYSVFTLDLEQRASTNLISTTKLPTDIWKVVPLPMPIGGALLVGTNEFVHVDQSGKTNAVAVNEFAKATTNLTMTDQSDLNMKLEHCEIELLDSKTGDMLIVLDDGYLAILTFKLLGRNVGGLNVTRVATEKGGALVEAAPSCVASMSGKKLFVGSEDGDATLLSWSRPAMALSRKRSHAEMLGYDGAADEDEESDELDDDDLYSTADPLKRTTSTSSVGLGDTASGFRFEKHDTLPSLGPINNICFGRKQPDSKDKLELAAGIGRGRASRLAFISTEIVPDVVGSSDFKNGKDSWAVQAKNKTPSEHDDARPDYDNLLFFYEGESTKVFDIVTSTPHTEDEIVNTPIYTERTGTEFESEGETLAVSTLAQATKVVQCRRSDIVIYDGADLALSQIIPMLDDETDAELKIVHSSFCDPYLLVLRDDSSVQVLKVVESGEVEPLDAAGAIKERRWHSGCLYAGEMTEGETTLFLLGEEGGLHVLSLPGFETLYHAPTLSSLSAVLSSDAPLRRVGAKETLTELLFTNLGPLDAKQPFLILRSAMDDLTLYEPWNNTAGRPLLADGLRFRKVPLTHTPKYDETATEENEGRPSPLKSINVGGYVAVHVPGASPSFIMKEASSLPKVISLRAKGVKSVMSLHHKNCQHGFGIVDDDGLRECRLPDEAEFGSGWCVRKMSLGEPAEENRHVAFHEDRKMYVVATCRDVDFYLPEEDGRHVEQDDITLRPQVPQYTLHLLSATSRNTIHSLEMPYLETVTSLKVMPLEVSEHTHEQKAMIVVGTSIQRGEDMPAKGAVTVFDILDVVPDPDRDESGYKLHVISREETKGAITALESFPGGFIGTAQGQKIMIRGLKEDGSCLPVAFLDAQCHTLQLKTLARSGMWLAADAWKGLWFGGFTEEPYKLSVLGKSRAHMEVLAAEFLPFDGQLYLMIIDAAMDLHVLQYDPENPKSLSGTRLLHRSTFHIGHFPTSMTLLPSTLAPIADQPIPNGHNNDEETAAPTQQSETLFQILTTSLTGSMSLITPVDESAYRRLGSLQTHLTSVLEHAAGLNPRAYRAVESEGFGSRGVIDGSVVQRIWELGAARRSEVLGRADMDAWSLRSDLEVIGGGGLGWF